MRLLIKINNAESKKSHDGQATATMNKKHIVVDEESYTYLDWVIKRIQDAGVRNVSKGDALRFVIKMNQNIPPPFITRSAKQKKKVEVYL
jgi:hypothetical protein